MRKLTIDELKVGMKVWVQRGLQSLNEQVAVVTAISNDKDNLTPVEIRVGIGKKANVMASELFLFDPPVKEMWIHRYEASRVGADSHSIRVYGEDPSDDAGDQYVKYVAVEQQNLHAVAQ